MRVKSKNGQRQAGSSAHGNHPRGATAPAPAKPSTRQRPKNPRATSISAGLAKIFYAEANAGRSGRSSKSAPTAASAAENKRQRDQLAMARRLREEMLRTNRYASFSLPPTAPAPAIEVRVVLAGASVQVSVAASGIVPGCPSNQPSYPPSAGKQKEQS